MHNITIAVIVVSLLSSGFARAQQAIPPLHAEICWQAPTENVDGTPISGLDHFDMFIREGSGPEEAIEIPASESCYLYDGTARGEVTITVDMTATDIEQDESDRSNQVQKTLSATVKTLVDLQGLPYALNGAFPESRLESVTFPHKPDGDVVLSLTVHDADIDNEGTLTIGAWTQALFNGQLGADNQVAPVTYTIPASAFPTCDVEVLFTHDATAGYRVDTARFSFDEGEPCTVTPPPTLVEMPILRIR